MVNFWLFSVFSFKKISVVVNLISIKRKATLSDVILSKIERLQLKTEREMNLEQLKTLDDGHTWPQPAFGAG